MVEELSLALPLSSTTGSQVDLDGLVDTYAGLLFRVAHSVLRNRAEAEDAVQDTFVRVLEHRSTLPAVRDLRVWLVRITWNLALDRRRRVRPEQMNAAFVQALAARGLPADLVLEDAQRMAAALNEIDKLPKPERQALLLAAFEEFEIAEVATVMNKSESATRALLFRARTRLRQRLSQKGIS